MHPPTFAPNIWVGGAIAGACVITKIGYEPYVRYICAKLQADYQNTERFWALRQIKMDVRLLWAEKERWPLLMWYSLQLLTLRCVRAERLMNSVWVAPQRFGKAKLQPFKFACVEKRVIRDYECKSHFADALLWINSDEMKAMQQVKSCVLCLCLRQRQRITIDIKLQADFIWPAIDCWKHTCWDLQVHWCCFVWAGFIPWFRSFVSNPYWLEGKKMFLARSQYLLQISGESSSSAKDGRKDNL